MRTDLNVFYPVRLDFSFPPEDNESGGWCFNSWEIHEYISFQIISGELPSITKDVTETSRGVSIALRWSYKCSHLRSNRNI